MQFEVTGSSAFSVLDVGLEEGERLLAQPKSMVFMSTGVDVAASLGGVAQGQGILGSVQGLLAGESIALARFSAKRNGERVVLAPEHVGPILPLHLRDGRDLMLSKGSYLASGESVSLSTVFTGAKGILAKKGVYLVRASGPGELFLSSHGDICELALSEGEKVVIDNDFVIAFDVTVSYALVTASKKISHSFLSGEGLVNRYTGPGTIYYSTRARQRGGFWGTLFNAMT